MDDASGGRRGTRAVPTDGLLSALDDAYGIRPEGPPADLGGSSNLNLLVRQGRDRWVIRVYRPHVTAARLTAIHAVRHHLDVAGVPCGGLQTARDGSDWIAVGDRLVEVERYIDRDSDMNSWTNLQLGMPVLARIHDELRMMAPSTAASRAQFANYLSAAEALDATQRGTRRIRSWDPSPRELELAELAEQLAHEVAAIELATGGALPVQLVHGDFWDNNVFIRRGAVVFIADFDFMGVRPRTDDLALTLFFACMQYRERATPDELLRGVARLVSVYEEACASPLTESERAALPAAIARQPLWSIGGWVALLDGEETARRHAAGCFEEVRWALSVVRDLSRWQAAFVGRS
jgi:Ser/Thr protein kinase RdoA (MazF antagonist)